MGTTPLAARGLPPEEERLAQGRALEAAGQLEDAVAVYDATARQAHDAPVVRAEALRRHGVLDHRRGSTDVGIARCRESRRIAQEIGHEPLEVEAMNALATIDLDRGELESAEATYRDALARAGDSLELRGRIEQNLGILANIRGDWDEAQQRYRASLDAFLANRNARGCAIAYHNLGMIHADNEDWGLADWYFTLSLGLARSIGDRYLQGLCLLNHAEVHVANKRVGEAMADADEALGVFTMLGSKMDMAAAHKQLGIACRETGALRQAEERFVTALGLAVATGSALVEADTCREMALLCRKQGRNQDALQLLHRAHTLFGKLDARADLVDVAAATRKLEETFVKVVREWGLSIESADSYTYGHCNRVAQYGVQVASELGLPAAEITAIHLGAYLHDLGKIEVPAEILNKPGRLTPQELEIIQRHPEAGVRMLDKVQFPWDLKPIIRWHHEKYDGSGYPDRLVGDEIPLNAQIICIADVYDAITTNRSYRQAYDKDTAIQTMRECAHWWRPDVFEAFLRVADRLEATIESPGIEAAA